MEIKDQVCSLQFAKALEGLGVKQDSLWYFVRVIGTHPCGQAYSREWDFWLCGDLQDENEMFEKEESDFEEIEYYSAFTVAELGNLLPDTYMSWRIPSGTFMCRINESHQVYHEKRMITTGKTEADARANMLIHLIQNMASYQVDFAYQRYLDEKGEK